MSPDDVHFHRITYKAGLAPYLASFDQLSTWLIGKVEYMSYNSPKVEVSPGLRFFYRNFYLEGGSSFNGFWYINFMTVF